MACLGKFLVKLLCTPLTADRRPRVQSPALTPRLPRCYLCRKPPPSTSALPRSRGNPSSACGPTGPHHLAILVEGLVPLPLTASYPPVDLLRHQHHCLMANTDHLLGSEQTKRNRCHALAPCSSRRGSRQLSLHVTVSTVSGVTQGQVRVGTVGAVWTGRHREDQRV